MKALENARFYIDFLLISHDFLLLDYDFMWLLSCSGVHRRRRGLGLQALEALSGRALPHEAATWMFSRFGAQNLEFRLVFHGFLRIFHGFRVVSEAFPCFYSIFNGVRVLQGT